MLAMLTLVPILWLHADGVLYQEVEVPEPNGDDAGYSWIVCVREYEADELRCYATHPEHKDIRYQDYELTEETR